MRTYVIVRPTSKLGRARLYNEAERAGEEVRPFPGARGALAVADYVASIVAKEPGLTVFKSSERMIAAYVRYLQTDFAVKEVEAERLGGDAARAMLADPGADADAVWAEHKRAVAERRWASEQLQFYAPHVVVGAP